MPCTPLCKILNRAYASDVNMPSQTKWRNVGWKTSTLFIQRLQMFFLSRFTFFNVFYFFLERFFYIYALNSHTGAESSGNSSSSSSSRNIYTRRSKSNSQLNKWVFSSFLTMADCRVGLTQWSRQTVPEMCPATWKARSPKPVWVRETTQVETSDERSRRRPTSETSWQ